MQQNKKLPIRFRSKKFFLFSSSSGSPAVVVVVSVFCFLFDELDEQVLLLFDIFLECFTAAGGGFS